MNDLRSTVYRTDPLTAADYDEAIRNLTDAREQIESGDLWRGCGYCGSEEHQPNTCHHNPIVLARQLVTQREAEYWRCFHCSAVFSLEQESLARQHFGLREQGRLPLCIQERLAAAGLRYEQTIDDECAHAFVLRLP